MATPTIEKQGALRAVWPEQGQWTFGDWLRLPDDSFRYEIIEGELYVSPPPSTNHQVAVSSLLAAMHYYANRGGLGLVLTAPIGVRLPDRETTVQPDVLFISRDRQDIVKDDVIDGAPDLVVEILSPSNWVYDRSRKQEAYQQAGVREYWIVDYRARSVDVLVLEGNEYVQRGHYGEGDVAPSEVLAGFSIPVSDIFAR
jgi:Uma2 family endonuclease